MKFYFLGGLGFEGGGGGGGEGSTSLFYFKDLEALFSMHIFHCLCNLT